MKKWLIVLLVMFGLNACVNAQKNDFTDMDVKEFSNYLSSNKDVQLLDVRTPEEFAEGHLADAINIDVFNPDFLKISLATLDKTKPVAVYCRSGKRSADAAAILAKNGYDVTNLEGGILAWIKDKKPVE